MPKKSAQEKNKIQDFLFTKFLGSPRFLGFFLILLLFFSFYLRIEPALFGYSHFSFDQGLDQIMVKRLVVDKDITLISRYTGLEGVFMGPLYMWFMSIPFLISGGSPHFNIIFMSLVGIVSSGITYFLVRKMTDSTVAFFVTFFTAMSPAFIGA